MFGYWQILSPDILYLTYTDPIVNLYSSHTQAILNLYLCSICLPESIHASFCTQLILQGVSQLIFSALSGGPTEMQTPPISNLYFSVSSLFSLLHLLISKRML